VRWDRLAQRPAQARRFAGAATFWDGTQGINAVASRPILVQDAAGPVTNMNQTRLCLDFAAGLPQKMREWARRGIACRLMDGRKDAVGRSDQAVSTVAVNTACPARPVGSDFPGMLDTMVSVGLQ